MFSAGQIIIMVVLALAESAVAAFGIVFSVCCKREYAKFIQNYETESAAVNVTQPPEPIMADDTAAACAEPAEQAAEPEQAAEETPAVCGAPSDSGEEPDGDEIETSSIVTEGQERVRYDRSLTAKICRLKNETKEWYSEIKNELMSYKSVRCRMSWRRETFKAGRKALARIMVRGRTLCLMLAVQSADYQDTKYRTEDISHVAADSDTPTMYRIKSAKRAKYAKEMIASIMNDNAIPKNPKYEAQDYFMPYVGDMALMQRGLVKRIVIGSTRTFRIEEVSTENSAAGAYSANSKI